MMALLARRGQLPDEATRDLAGDGRDEGEGVGEDAVEGSELEGVIKGSRQEVRRSCMARGLRWDRRGRSGGSLSYRGGVGESLVVELDAGLWVWQRLHYI